MGQSKLGRHIFLLPVVLLIVVVTDTARAADIDGRMTVIEAIEFVREQGHVVSYSSQLVKPWMRVRITPASTDPIDALREVLAEYSLALEDSSGNRWLVVRGDPAVRISENLVTGRVIDAESGDPVGNARIRTGTLDVRSGSDGRFELHGIATDMLDLRISASGYRDAQIKVSRDSLQDVVLQTLVAPPLEEITIVASRHSIYSRDGTTDQFLTGDEIQLMPHIADDAFRALHRLPGVAASDFQAPFNLRGGAIDENKVVLDGLELFEPYHMRTLYNPLSIIDPGIIGQAQMMSGGYTAEYGNHLSGVVDIVSSIPTGEPVHQLGVSFVSSFARSSGRFDAGRGAYQVSARRGYLDLLADTVTEDGEELNPRYNDIFAKVNFGLSDVVDLSARILSASDDTDFVDPSDGEDVHGDSNLNYAWFNVDLAPSESLTVRNVFFAGRVETLEDGQLFRPPIERITRTFSRDIDISGLQTDIDWQLNDRVMWKTGARYRKLSADYDYAVDSLRQTDIANNGQPYSLTRNIALSRSGEEYGVYAALRFRTSERLAWELGARWDKQTYIDNADETQTSPRVNAFFNINERTEVRLGWGQFYQPQGIHELQVQDGITRFFPAQQAEHRVLGIRHRFESGMEIQADIYEKLYDDLRPRFENAFDTYEFAPETNFDRVQVDPRNAESRGVEITLHNRRDKGLDWWFSYTWSEADDIIDGVSIPRSWDQRHAATGSVTWRGEHWTLSAVARYHSGWPRTPLLLLPVFDGGGNFLGAESDFSARNSNTYNDYSRVDIRLSRTVEFTNSQFEYYLEIYNVFDVDNQCCIPDHDLQIGPSVTATPNVDEYLPIFPSFGFVWTFGPGAARN